MPQPDTEASRNYKERLARIIGQTVRDRRESASTPISVDEFARRVGVGKSYLRNIEAGRKLPPYLTLHRIADALGISFAELLTGADDDSRLLAFVAEAETLADELAE